MPTQKKESKSNTFDNIKGFDTNEALDDVFIGGTIIDPETIKKIEEEISGWDIESK